MKKCILFFSIIFAFLLFSCSNLSKGQNDSSINFGLGKEIASQISRTVLSNRNVVPESEVRVECSLLSEKPETKTQIIPLKELEKVNFKFDNLDFDVEYKISINIFYNDILIYQAMSEPVILNSDFPDSKLKLKLNKKLSSITYSGRDSYTFATEPDSVYFIDSDLTLAIPVKEGFLFEGWFTTENFSGNEIKKLGKDCFLGSVTLYGKWSDSVAPGEVSGLKGIAEGTDVTLSWENPTDLDFAGVRIICKEDSGKNQELSKDSTSITIKDFKMDHTYNFTVSTLDNNGNISKGKSVAVYIEVKSPIESVICLPAGTDGTAGTSGTYVLFGDYPQSIKKNDVTIDESKSYTFNSFSCYKGSDGCFYVERTSASDRDVPDYPCANGMTHITKGEVNYFKLEPVKWRVLTDSYTDASNSVKGRLLLSENVLDASAILNESTAPDAGPGSSLTNRTINGILVYPNNYEYSTMRAMLNGLDGTSWGDSSLNAGNFLNNGFLQKTFSTKAQNLIKTVSVDNSESSCNNFQNTLTVSAAYVCNNTNDKVFLLSEREITTTDYGFLESSSRDKSRMKMVTDYALVTGMYRINNGPNIPGTQTWRLRSPGNNDNSGQTVGDDGKGSSQSYTYVGTEIVGVVPAIVVPSLP